MLVSYIHDAGCNPLLPLDITRDGKNSQRQLQLQTAAHCLDAKGITSITATLDLYSIDDDPTSVRVAAKSWSFHPSYDSVNIKNDIGIITLETGVSISPIQLSFEDGFPSSGTKTKVIGFGSTNGIIQEASRDLMEIELLVKSTNDCKNIYNTISTKQQICAGEFFGKVRLLNNGWIGMLLHNL
jgi:secreted trypsin-like serine protease